MYNDERADVGTHSRRASVEVKREFSFLLYFAFGELLESKPSDLESCWNPNFQIWRVIGIQTFRFGELLESKLSDLESYWNPNLQIWIISFRIKDFQI
jgi:hypothetical protein